MKVFLFWIAAALTFLPHFVRADASRETKIRKSAQSRAGMRSDFSKNYTQALDRMIKSGRYSDSKTGAALLIHDFENASRTFELQSEKYLSAFSEKQIRTTLERVRKQASESGDLKTYTQVNDWLSESRETPLAKIISHEWALERRSSQIARLHSALAQNEGSVQKLLVQEQEKMLSRKWSPANSQAEWLLFFPIIEPLSIGILAVDTVLIPVYFIFGQFRDGQFWENWPPLYKWFIEDLLAPDENIEVGFP